MITKVIKLKLQYFKHVYVQARPPDKSVYRKIIYFISHPKHMYVGTQKNHLNETVLLSTLNTCLN